MLRMRFLASAHVSRYRAVDVMLRGDNSMDLKLYIEWRQSLGKWVVKFHGDVVAKFDTQSDALHWKRVNYPEHGHEVERVQVRTISPRGARRGEWR